MENTVVNISTQNYVYGDSLEIFDFIMSTITGEYNEIDSTKPDDVNSISFYLLPIEHQTFTLQDMGDIKALKKRIKNIIEKEIKKSIVYILPEINLTSQLNNEKYKLVIEIHTYKDVSNNDVHIEINFEFNGKNDTITVRFMYEMLVDLLNHI